MLPTGERARRGAGEAAAIVGHSRYIVKMADVPEWLPWNDATAADTHHNTPGRRSIPAGAAALACRPMANPYDTLAERGFIHDVSDADALRALFDEGSVTFYYGCDPTSTSLHVGNLIGIMAMAWLQRSGHRPIALAGGGTGRIGDPSFREDERELMSEEQIAHNMDRIREQLSRIIDLSDPSKGLLVDNYDWLRELQLIDFLRDVGKHFSVNQMISREAVRRRLEEREQGISFTEFSYQLLQAYDFAHLHATEGCLLQIGGSDQWGNITAGIDLTRRMHGGRVHGLTWPLLERSDGKKISKTADHDAPVLAPDETSPYAFYQWFLNVPDADVDRFLKLFTFLPLDEIADLVAQGEADPAARIPQKALAEGVTRTVHGEEGLAEALATTAAFFGKASITAQDDQWSGYGTAISPIDFPISRLGDIGLLELMVELGAASSNSEARRLVTQGGVTINDNLVDDPALVIEQVHLDDEGAVTLRRGKKNYYLARFT